jgi:hypothetical protein
MTFVDPLHPFSQDPLHDLDMASYALVKSFPDLPWEPKESFRAVAGWYGARERDPV